MKTEIEISGIPFEAEFYFEPSEPEVRYYPNGDGYPGCPAYVELYHLWHKGTDFLPLIGSEKIEKQILEEMEDGNCGKVIGCLL